MENIRPLALRDEIRLGSTFDGGYLIPKRALETSENLITFGYGHDFNFEKAFLRMHKSNCCHLYESSISLYTVFRGFFGAVWWGFLSRRSFPLYRLRVLVKYLLMRITPGLNYHIREVRKLQESKNQISFQQILRQVSIQQKTILKVDIEGGEYELLPELFDSDFAAIIVEFHECSSNLEIFNAAIERSRKFFAISHIHINNFASVNDGIPNVIEVTFVNRNLVNLEEFSDFKDTLPVPLDSPCNPAKSDFIFNY